ncbi:MAG: tRNA (guanosine(46)-N7)-methyltransferase TrmB [Planctomycetaceae bacterium]
MNHEPLVDLKPYFLTLHDLTGPIDWREFFGNDHPVEIDVGCGRGLFLLTAGLANPDVNYLGLEIEYKEGRHGARRIQKRSMPNVRIIGGDAKVALDKFIPRASVSAVHVYFPDPWWKRRHRRRRIFTDELVAQIEAVLIPGGLLHSWTDVVEYFQVIEALMDLAPGFTIRPAPAVRTPENDLDYQTSFERKKRKLGCPIYRGLWQKKR